MGICIISILHVGSFVALFQRISLVRCLQHLLNKFLSRFVVVPTTPAGGVRVSTNVFYAAVITPSLLFYLTLLRVYYHHHLSLW